MPKAKAKAKNISLPSPHNYLYPGTQILKNKYGETDLKLFLEKCSHDIEQAKVNLLTETLPECFDSAYLCHIHKQLFKNTFEWAGYLRHTSFTFADGSSATMPEMKRTEWGNAFSTGEKILENLQKLDQTLAEKDNLQGLTREEFVEEATSLFDSLHKIHPFIDGNEHAEQIFFENLAKAAGHQLDFSLATKERMMAVRSEAMQYGNTQLIKDLFEDISHPTKRRLLKEFIGNANDTGRDVSNRLVMVTKTGETYIGTYRGSGSECFVIDMQGTLVIGNKDDLAPERLKSLKPGDTISFTAPNSKELENILIPKEALAPLTKSECAKKVMRRSYVLTAQKRIRQCAKAVYGDANILNEQIAEIITNPELSQQLADQIRKIPSSISPLAGFSIFGLQSQARVNARNHIDALSTAVASYGDIVERVHHAITQKHQIKQESLGRAVEKPSQNLQNLFSLSPEQQRENLSQSPQLYRELSIFIRSLERRLSSNEWSAIRNKDYETLAQSIGISEQKAREITDIVQNAKNAHNQSYTRTQSRSNELAMAS
ncbi:BID domain-containing T4SS effector [Bartonella tribocorum]|uniref:protein adenylyltransferase n=1 Tax=Bartonella tribocorum TaxID=85701 RepID=A0A2M6URM3_9HYPH|nr:BID domain-containing T4SS effector [Bartonella tribocorum]PIT68835.1 adenosine monophosphate-protein transferase [Bartonella tribocorum]